MTTGRSSDADTPRDQGSDGPDPGPPNMTDADDTQSSADISDKNNPSMSGEEGSLSTPDQSSRTTAGGPRT